MSNYTKVMNGLARSATMLTSYQGNFNGVLNRFVGSETMLGLRRGEEHRLDFLS